MKSKGGVALVQEPRESWERDGTRAYNVFLNGERMGEVKRYRERYPYKNIGGNVALFRSRWSWRNSHESRSFNTRKEAVESLLRARTVG